MKKIWYGSDEVKDFHPVVNECLNTALRKADLDRKYVIMHHYGQFTTGIPDFALLDKTTQDYVCIIEVKKTPSDVFYFGSGYQSKGYVDELYPLRWKQNHQPHFCVTNIEISQFYCRRDTTSLIGCLLVGSPHDCGILQEEQTCYDRFISLFTQYFRDIDNCKDPEFSMHLEAISESFNETFFSLAQILGVNLVRMTRLVQGDDLIKQSILYELLRFAFYYYIRETYEIQSSPFSQNFPDFNVKDLSSKELLETIENNFAKAMEVDFCDILRDYKENEAIVPNKLRADTMLADVFSTFIDTLKNNAAQGIKKNTSLLNFVSLLTEEIYDKEEKHSLGKVMSDEILSDILAELAIDTENDNVIDPCCGDGNLLLSAYNKLKDLNPEATHNKLLPRLTGIEIDANLIQLAAFKLICSNIGGVNKETVTDLKHMDLFEEAGSCTHQALVMNPPFLRHEDLDPELKKKYLDHLATLSGKHSFIEFSAQPNLYFFFVEKAINILKDDGKASIILMTKFLNNRDGEHLKRYLLPYLNAVISYPPNFFKGFVVTTCIILLSKENNKENVVTFLRVKDANLFSSPNRVKDIIRYKENSVNDQYSAVNIPNNSLRPDGNWRIYLVDPEDKFGQFERISLLKPLSDYFDTTQRGGAENCGGSSIIYPYSSNNPLKDDVKDIEERFIIFGLQRNKLSEGNRRAILTEKCLNAQRGIHFPATYSTDSDDGIDKRVTAASGLRSYCKKLINSKIKGKPIDLEKIMNTAHGSVVLPDIIIPRADRAKHIVYYNSFKDRPILMSTNFFYVEGLKNYNTRISEDKQIQFIVAFLNSTFGQIQFEIHANNQEGMRKIEGFMIEKLKVPDLNEIQASEIDAVIKEFKNLDSREIGFLGTEKDNPRRNLDIIVGEIIYARDNLGFSSVAMFVDYLEDFLKDIVLDRAKDRLYE